MLRGFRVAVQARIFIAEPPSVEALAVTVLATPRIRVAAQVLAVDCGTGRLVLESDGGVRFTVRLARETPILFSDAAPASCADLHRGDTVVIVGRMRPSAGTVVNAEAIHLRRAAVPPTPTRPATIPPTVTQAPTRLPDRPCPTRLPVTQPVPTRVTPTRPLTARPTLIRPTPTFPPATRPTLARPTPTSSAATRPTLSRPTPTLAAATRPTQPRATPTVPATTRPTLARRTPT